MILPQGIPGTAALAIACAYLFALHFLPALKLDLVIRFLMACLRLVAWLILFVVEFFKSQQRRVEAFMIGVNHNSSLYKMTKHQTFTF